MNEEAQLNRIESKLDTTIDRVTKVETSMAVLEAKFDPLSKLMWAVITAGAIGLMSTVMSAIVVFSKGR